MIKIPLFLALVFLSHPFFCQGIGLLEGKGEVNFLSNAPLETIKASSDQLRGMIDLSKQTFAFSFHVNTFTGFNSPLQKEHYNEHYMESEKFPKATYTGKLINFEVCKKACKTNVITKGKLNIHGVERIVTIPVTINMILWSLKWNK